MSEEIELPHEKLLAYRLAMDLMKQVQAMEVADARLRDQLVRASKSVCLNIGEGVGRLSDADKRRVYGIARGECCETAAALDVAIVAGDVDSRVGRRARETAGRVYALLTGLIRRYGNETFAPKSRVPEQDPSTGSGSSSTASTSTTTTRERDPNQSHKPHGS